MRVDQVLRKAEDVLARFEKAIERFDGLPTGVKSEIRVAMGEKRTVWTVQSSVDDLDDDDNIILIADSLYAAIAAAKRQYKPEYLTADHVIVWGSDPSPENGYALRGDVRNVRLDFNDFAFALIFREWTVESA